MSWEKNKHKQDKSNHSWDIGVARWDGCIIHIHLAPSSPLVIGTLYTIHLFLDTTITLSTPAIPSSRRGSPKFKS
jgi:hypothetical protein